ncbi:Glucose/arabinose dehydrogenase, beta-propeller fold [Micromonospora pattaloongensis]|uniref:Glucose/arabinose dehydrogenase, beta-propeller fold n=1 Tax=Micromonospora pattaloongensis TaxID=405436 RepID=A0A1H3RGQ5_9ACTN|nr:ThuA domain-containing protein [Micromonospora pattaloongensis]SDZ24525.1 Glucose/arabinose dehydrogenase, beta-propeller fold [Micromonospora pattaloongensis]
MSRRSLRQLLAAVVTPLLALPIAAALSAPAQAAPAAAQAAAPDFRALVFSKTAGFRHSSIPQGIAAIQQLGQQHNFAVDTTEDSAAFTDDNLSNYDVVIWLSTTGDVLNGEQQGAFERYIERGGGYAGVHAAADTEYDWAFYGGLVGAYFKDHPAIQQSTVRTADRMHPSTKDIPSRWTRTDEWYNYQTNPRGKVHVLATLDEKSYNAGGGAMGLDHPIAWCHDYRGGRSWYTGGGHTEASYAEPEFLKHLLGGIQSAAGAVAADCGATVDANFEQVTLARGADTTGEPMNMAVLPDRRVLHTSRDGRVFITSPSGTTTLAGRIPVYNHDEDGLQGVGVDPGFAGNGWIYLYYAPPLSTPEGDAPNDGTAADFARFDGVNRLSRFTLTGDAVDLASEKKILEVPANRGICCHAGGDIAFDAAGNLYLSTGDDSNPFASNGYTPIDERAGRNPAYDAQRASGNTNDLRGKVLRIKVNADGSYDVPAGNLFPAGEAGTRPEIYAMGFRNPFRFTVDPKTGWLYLGEYGPDAGGADPNRGPAGMVEFNQIRQAGNFGWPYCVGPNVPFNDVDFATGTSGAKFDCAAPKNDSPRNTGKRDLPAAQPAWIAYDGASVPEFGDGSESPMGGPVYRYDPNLKWDTKFPAYFDGTFFAAEWGRGWIKNITLDEQGRPLAINPFAEQVVRPMDIEFGPDGSLYVLDYGSGYFGGAPDSALYRIDYVKGKRSPVAVATGTPTSGAAPLTVTFSSAGTRDPDPGDALSYSWDFDGDGTADSTEPNPTFTYTTKGQFTARLTVTDPAGNAGSASVQVTVGNTAPVVAFASPPAGGIFQFGDQVPFKATVTDPEDGTVDCDRVQIDYALGHDTHSHGLVQTHACEGVLSTVADDGHGDATNLYGVLAATYTDKGADGLPALTGQTRLALQPRTRQAEHLSETGGAQVVDAGGARGGKRVGYIDDGDWIAFDTYNLTGITGVQARVSSGGGGGRIEFRVDSPTGPLAATVPVSNTGSYDNYVDSAVAPVTDPGGTHRLYLVFKGSGGGLFDVDAFTFHGKGVASNGRPEVTAAADVTAGKVPVNVTFTANGTDRDGDTLRYAWEFGDGATSTEQNPSHTYTRAGLYTAKVTATDASGLAASATVKINAYVLAPPCADPSNTVNPDDEFTGDAIDRCRWNVLREDPAHYRVSGGALQVDALPGDMYGGTTDAKNILLQKAPAGPWQAVTKVTIDHSKTYEQAGILVHGDDRNFVKFAFIEVPNGVRNFEFIHQQDGSPIDGGAVDRSPNLAFDFPNTVWMRVVSDGQTVTAAYSTDGEQWTTVGRPRSLAAVPNPSVGLAAFNGTGNPVTFDFFRVDDAPQHSCTPTKPEEGYASLFDGTPGSLGKWKQAGPGGFLHTGDCTLLSYGGLGLYWYDQPFGDYSLKLDWKMAGDDNAGVFVGFPNPGTDPWLAVNKGHEIQIDATDVPEKTTGAIYNFQSADLAARDAALKPPGEWNAYEIVVRGQTITVYLNGTKINQYTDTDPERMNAPSYIGIQNHGNEDDVHFRNVRIKELTDTTAPVTTATPSPAGPDGSDGWYRSDVTVTLAATDDDSGVDRTEYRLGGDWQPYTEPVLVTGDGERTLEYRSVDKAGNTEQARSLTLKRDGTAPVSSAAFAPSGDAGWHRGAVPVTISATDGASGVAKVEYSLDGGAWATYADSVEVRGDGQHTLRYRATDRAGNVEDVKAAVLKIDGTAPTVLLSGVADGGRYGDSQDVRVTFSATDGTSGLASVTGTLDGRPILDGTLVGLFELSLGKHTLAVSATDKAGNTSTRSVSFTVTTSTKDMANLIDRFRSTGWLSDKGAQRLHNSLAKVRQFEDAGQERRAVAQLERFRALVEDPKLVSNAEVRAVLLRDADAVNTQLSASIRGGGR